MNRQLPPTIGTSRGVSVEGASAGLLAELLREFEREVRARGVELDRYLQPGASRADIVSVFAGAGLVAPEEAIALFEWHNGRIEVPGAFSALPVFPLWSLEYLEGFLANNAFHPRGFGRWEWNPNWVHIMGDQNGLAMSCADDPQLPPLIRFVSDDGSTSTQEDDTSYQVVSLCTPVSWWIDSIRRGWYQWEGKSGTWIRDAEAQPLIRAIYSMT
jgi:hypothetical protein